jgi:hypothetical protein
VWDPLSLVRQRPVSWASAIVAPAAPLSLSSDPLAVDPLEPPHHRRRPRRPEDEDPSSSSSTEFLRGAMAAIANIVLTFPIHKTMFRQQVEGHGVTVALRGIVAEGLWGVYRGVGPPLAQKSLSMAAMFGLYDWYMKAILMHFHGTDNKAHLSGWGLLSVQAGAAMLAGSTESILTPLERAQSLLQHRHFNGHFSHTWDCLVKLQPYGLAEYYRGVIPILLRNGPSSALFFCLRDPCRDLLPEASNSES